MLVAPMTVDINLTNRCNLRCAFCSATPFHHTTKTDELTLAEIVGLFDQIEDMGVFLVRLAGGEPLVRRDIIPILEDAGRRAFDTVVLTNGVFLAEPVVAAIRGAGINSLGISVDGPTAALHDAHRGVPGTFDTVMGNLERLRRHDVTYSAMTTVTSRNCGSLVEVVEFLDDRGFERVNFILLNFSGMARSAPDDFSGFPEWRAEFLRLTRHLAERRPRIGVSVLPPHEDPVPYEMYVPLRDAGELELLETVWGIPYRDIPANAGIGCAAGKTQLTVFENGDVYGCELMRDADAWRAGSVRTMPLQDIWDTSAVFQQLRSMKKRDLTGKCGSCPLEVCGGGCRASAFNQTGSIVGSDTNCHLDRRRTHLPVLA
jgi:radical SAM protein with 4Fe4S-binding SPASM domain